MNGTTCESVRRSRRARFSSSKSSLASRYKEKHPKLSRLVLLALLDGHHLSNPGFWWLLWGQSQWCGDQCPKYRQSFPSSARADYQSNLMLCQLDLTILNQRTRSKFHWRRVRINTPIYRDVYRRILCNCSESLKSTVLRRGLDVLANSMLSPCYSLRKASQ